MRFPCFSQFTISVLASVFLLTLSAPTVSQDRNQEGAGQLRPSHQDVLYLEGGDPRRNVLDIYAPDDAKGLPVVLYVHGGGWSRGDKKAVHSKALLFTNEDYLFISTNYRLSPSVKHPVHVSDIAAVIAWVHRNIGGYGGDPERIGIMGHSAGAHLVSLVATDERRLAAHGLKLNVIKAVIPIDGGYEIAEFVETDPPRWSPVFTSDPKAQKDASPLYHVEAGKGIAHPDGRKSE